MGEIMILIKHLAILSLFLTLCAQANDNELMTKIMDNKKNSSTQNVNIDLQSPIVFNPTPDLIEKYKDKKLEILDCSEIILDGSSTLVVTFSVPLLPKLNFTNLLRLVDKETGVVDGVWELSDNGLELRHRYLAPNRKLALTIDKMLTAINNSRLQSVYEKELTTQDRHPMVNFASTGLLLPSKSMSGLPVTTLNVNKVDINFFKIKPDKLSDFIHKFGFINKLSVWRSEEMNGYADLVYSSRFDLNPKPNAQETVLVNLSKINELNQEGVYVAVMNESGTYNESNPATLFSISNIGISVHNYKNHKFTVMAYGLDDGKPLANVEIACRNRGKVDNNCQYILEKTDQDGYAEFTMDNNDEYRVLTASDGKQTSFIYIDRNALNLTEFDLSGTPYYDKQLFVFGPRDLYRPDETVYFNALLRNADGQPLPNQPIIADMISANGRVVKNFQLKSNADTNGLYQANYVIPSDAATGKWSIRFNLGDDIYRYWYFKVEEFLPERMAMEITSSSSGPILSDEDVYFDIKGWYLYGAPASDNRLDANVYLKKVDSIAGLADFKIGSVTDANLYSELGSFEEKLDNNGLKQLHIKKNSWSNLRSPVKVVLQASLLDSGGRPITRYATQTIWPANKLPAIRALFADSPYYDWNSDNYYERPTVDIGTNAEFEIAYVNLEGEKLGTNSLKTRLIHERRQYYWTWSNEDGWQVNYNSSDIVISEDQLSIEVGSTTKISYLSSDYGSYRIEVVDADSKVVTSFRFWSGYDWEDNTHGTKSVRPDQVKLSIDKPFYHVGDVAKVNVQAPVVGSGYISLETNDGIIWKKAITVGENGLDVDIPIENWGRHDIYINAMIIRPSTDAAIQTVKRAMGLLYLPTDTTKRHLNISIDSLKQVHPESIVPIKIKMDKQFIQKDKKVIVLVSAVDSGVLNITDYVTPDPYVGFLGRKRYDVDIFDVYGSLIEASGRNVTMSFGGDAMGTGGKKTSNDVFIVAQQLETIQLNDQGEGIVDLQLPNFNGELRIMAQAWDDNRFGKAEKTIKVAAPVIAELSTPRFLSGGDQAVLALDLHNLTDTIQTMQVEISTTGLIHQNDAKSISVKLDSKQKHIIQIPVAANFGYGIGTITVDVKGIVMDDNKDFNIRRSWNIGVRPAYAPTLRYYQAVLDENKSWKLPDQALTELIKNTVEGQLVVSNQPPLNIAQYIKSLFAYPYGCLEQTISGLFPSLYANNEQLAQLGIKTDSDDKRREKVHIGILRILSMQRSNGSFGLWSSHSEEEHWLTVYATDFLLQAKERGYQVNDKALDAAMMRLGQYVYDSSSFNHLYYYGNEKELEFEKLSIKAYALMILSKYSKISSAMRNEINYLSNKINNDTSFVYSPLPLAQLAVSAKINGMTSIYDKLLPLIFTTPFNYSKWLGNYGSKIRDQALILSLLIENDMAQKDQASFLFILSELLNEQRYYSTQELNALFIAGWSLEQHKKDNKFKLAINDNVAKVNSIFSNSYHYEALTKGLSINNSKYNQPLYLKFSLSGYGQTAPAPTSQDGFFNISRTYYDLLGNKINPSQLEVGTIMVVILDVTSKEPVHDALIVDYLPAGLELENQNLSNSSVHLSSIPSIASLLKDDDVSQLKYQEFRDDRYVAAVNIQNDIGQKKYHKRVAYLVRAVTTGNYMIPHPYVESMYRPDRFAIGQSPSLMTISVPIKKVIN